MLFLIEYNRSAGEIVSFETFTPSQQKAAEESRMRKELRLNRSGSRNEVVLLEAKSETALRKTHRRYFESLSQLSPAIV